jgi:putative membrane protein
MGDTEINIYKKSNIFKKNKLIIVLLSAVFINLVFSILVPVVSNSNRVIFRIIAGIGLVIFVLFHGVKRYGWKNIVIFFAITSVISWSMETFSIETVFPFGKYHYSDILGVKIGKVPLVIMPAYFFSGYLAWTMGSVFLGDLGKAIKKRNLFFIPFISAFILVMWNYCFDPIMSTIYGLWIWEDGGAFYGVPLSNYYGWFITAYLFFQVFALFIYKFGDKDSTKQGKFYWSLVPIMFISLGSTYLVNPFFRTTNIEIYSSMFLGTVFTMVFVSVLCLIFINRYYENIGIPDK